MNSVNYGTDANATIRTMGNLEIPSGPPVRSKSPRLSAFNLLNDAAMMKMKMKIKKNLMSPREEEVEKMKSVYKVYFDREKSQK